MAEVFRRESGVISIHALRGEGDFVWLLERSIVKRISIHALRGEGDWRLTLRQVTSLYISIHALRGEGDLSRFSVALLPDIFQSTPSVGRATWSA